MIRLDSLMVKRNIVSSREKAKSLILAGQVKVKDKVALKPSMLIDENEDINLEGEMLRYVGRGGLKLEKAVEFFDIKLNDKICADIGASTGGFTDCMLQSGAKKVYAVDVGHGQLADKLINDSRVINLEGLNVKYLTHEHISESIEFISVDVSFISLTLLLPVLYEFLNDDGEMVCLIKPQFEAGKSNIGKKGIVKSQDAHINVLEKIYSFCLAQKFQIKGLTSSPVKGGEGNIEYLIYLKKCNDNSVILDFRNIVKNTFDLFSK